MSCSLFRVISIFVWPWSRSHIWYNHNQNESDPALADPDPNGGRSFFLHLLSLFFLYSVVIFIPYFPSCSRYQQRQPRPQQPWRPDRNGGRRGKRIRRQMTPSADQPAESIRFPRELLISQFSQILTSVHSSVSSLLFSILFLNISPIFLALVVSASENGYADLVFGVQWSWTEPEERAEQLQGLSDCVSRRLDQGAVINRE